MTGGKRRQFISRGEAIAALAMLAFYLPPKYALPGPVHAVWLAFLYAVSATASAVNAWQLIRNPKSPRLPFLAVFLFLTWSHIGTRLFSPDATWALGRYLRNVGFVSFLNCCLLSEKPGDTRAFLRGYLLTGIVMTAIHYVSFLLLRNTIGGMRAGEQVIREAGRITNQNYYFLTYDNNTVYYFLPVACALFFYTYRYDRKASKLLLAYNAAVFSMYLAKSAIAAMLAMGILWLGEFLFTVSPRKTSGFPLLRYRNACAAGILFEVCVVALSGSSLALQFANVFRKRGALVVRAGIWRNSLEYFLARPLTGNGMRPAAETYLRIGQTHCHNLLIEILCVAGITGLLLFLFLLFACRPPKGRRGMEWLFSLAILAYFAAGSLDWLYENPLPYALFFFAFYLSGRGSQSVPADEPDPPAGPAGGPEAEARS